MEAIEVRLEKFKKMLLRTQLDVSEQRGEVIGKNELARYLGVSAASLSYWMSGVRPPDAVNKAILFKTYGTAIYDLFPEENPLMVLPDNPRLARLAAKLARMSPEDAEKILRFAEDMQGNDKNPAQAAP